MSSVERAIIKALEENNMSSCYIILNAEYLIYNRKRLKCRIKHVDNDSMLEFFIIKSGTENEVDKFEVLDAGLEHVTSRLYSTELFGMNLPIVIGDAFNIRAISSINAILLESQLYSYAKEIAEKQIEMSDKGQQFNFNSISLNTTEEISPEQYSAFMSNFWEKSRVAYRDTVYNGPNGSDSLFIKRLYKNESKNEFYKILNTFIPVFVDCSLFFNPLRDYNTKMTSVYKMAVEKGRFVKVEKSDFTITAYFLAQDEICEAFHMKHFMRFTPQFWYDIFVGLLYDQQGFPSISKRIMRGPKIASSYGISSVMSMEDFAQKVQAANDAIALNTSVRFNSVQTPGQDFLNFLNSYTEVDSLMLECENFANKITRIGAYVLDRKPSGGRFTKDDIYNIMVEAKL